MSALRASACLYGQKHTIGQTGHTRIHRCDEATSCQQTAGPCPPPRSQIWHSTSGWLVVTNTEQPLWKSPIYSRVVGDLRKRETALGSNKQSYRKPTLFWHKTADVSKLKLTSNKSRVAGKQMRRYCDNDCRSTPNIAHIIRGATTHLPVYWAASSSSVGRQSRPL